MTVHLKKVCQGLMAHLLIKNALYILIPSKLLNVSSDPQFEERVVEDTVSPSISMKSLAINAFLIPCTLAEISRRYSFSTGWACFFLRYLQQWFFSFTYLAFSLGRYGWFLLGLCRILPGCRWGLEFLGICS